MSNEIRQGYTAGNTLFAILRNQDNEVWYPTSEEWETYGTGSRAAADYAIALTEHNSFYVADMPDGIEAGTYYALNYVQAGGAPADGDTWLATQEIAWTGTAEEVAPVSEVGATEICNMAILRVGGAYKEKRINSFSTDTSDIAEACRDVYSTVRTALLERLGWLHALSYADLGAELAGSSLIDAAEWEYQFNLPDDCLWILRMTDEGDHTAEYEYEVKQGRLLTNDYSNTDGDSAYIEYVKNEGNIGLAMASFHIAFATAIAIEIGPILGVKNVDWLVERLERLDIPNAIAANQRQVYVEDEKGSFSWLDARDA